MQNTQKLIKISARVNGNFVVLILADFGIKLKLFKLLLNAIFDEIPGQFFPWQLFYNSYRNMYQTIWESSYWRM